MEFPSWLFFPSTLVGFLFAFSAPLIVRHLKHRSHLIMALIPLYFTCYFSLAGWELHQNQSWQTMYPWVSLFSTGITFSFDGLSILIALLISFVGLLIFLFSGGYLTRHRDLGKYYCFMTMFMTSMLGLILSDNLLLLFVFWEFTTFSSFFLIGFDHENELARKNAWQALLVTSLGSLAMLAGFILLAQVTGTYQISELLLQGSLIRSHELYHPILVLILIGAFTKSAQFPFHFWLPNAMTAPTPVSAYLHSATMVKAGIYLMARFSPVLAGTSAWFYIVTSAGCLTMLIGSMLSLIQTDLKQILAYMTIVALGLLTLMLGIGSTEAIKAALIFLLVHSLYKGALFLIVGGVDHAVGSRNIFQLGGMGKRMPITTLAALMSLLSLAGLPPFMGFMAKEMIYKASLAGGGMASLLFIIAIIFSLALITGMAAVIFRKVFTGVPTSASETIHENKIALWGPPLLLSFLGLLLGLDSSWMESLLIKYSISAVLGSQVVGDISPVLKFDLVLALSFLTVLLGLWIYLSFFKINYFLKICEQATHQFSPSRLYHSALNRFPLLALWITRHFQSGYQTKYLLIIFLTVTSALAYGLIRSGQPFWFPQQWPAIAFYEWVVAGGILTCAIAVILSKIVIATVILLGVVGYGVAIIYVIYGAPDLALTQFLIETLTIILIALMAVKFPKSSVSKTQRLNLFRDGSLSLAFGSIMTLILWNITQEPFNDSLSKFFAENSYSVGRGHNIVNVILVDFRALDTLGEITVLAMASLSFFSLIKLARRREGSG